MQNTTLQKIESCRNCGVTSAHLKRFEDRETGFEIGEYACGKCSAIRKPNINPNLKLRQVAFTWDRRGLKIAFEWRSWRWARLKLEDAEQMVATGTAREIEYQPF